MKIKIKKLKENAKLPTYAMPGDAGMDMYAMETIVLGPDTSYQFSHGFAMEIPEGYVALVKDKGGMANRRFHTLGGVFDSGYRGEYNTIIMNLSHNAYTIQEGDKVSQLVIMPVVQAELEEVTELSESERGDGRFGSTGK